MEKQGQWLLCPHCHGKTRVWLREDTILRNYLLFCPKCKQETLIDLRQFHSSFREFLCVAHGTGWSVFWNENADIDMDQRDYADQTGRSGHNHFIMWFCIYGSTVCWIYALARMEIGILQIYDLLCGCKSFSIRLVLLVATEKRSCSFFRTLMGNSSV